MDVRTYLPELDHIDYTDPRFAIKAITILAAAVIAAVFISKFAAERFKGKRKKVTACTLGVTLFTAFFLISIYGAGAIAVKGIILALILSYASYQDIRTRECDDCLSLMVVITALIGRHFSDLPYMILSAMFAGGVMVTSLLLTKSEIGGADIKMAVACSFMCGLTAGVAGLLIGMILAVVFNIAKKKRKKSFAMIPYLACGYMTAFAYSNLITGGI